jgi:hypothetical protein
MADGDGQWIVLTNAPTLGFHLNKTEKKKKLMLVKEHSME